MKKTFIKLWMILLLLLPGFCFADMGGGFLVGGFFLVIVAFIGLIVFLIIMINRKK